MTWAAPEEWGDEHGCAEKQGQWGVFKDLIAAWKA